MHPANGLESMTSIRNYVMCTTWGLCGEIVLKGDVNQESEDTEGDVNKESEDTECDVNQES